jgi:hypothetical protein
MPANPELRLRPRRKPHQARTVPTNGEDLVSLLIAKEQVTFYF